MTNYNELEQDKRVSSVDFVGGGVAVVELKPGVSNDGKTSFTAWCFSAAKDFVEAAA